MNSQLVSIFFLYTECMLGVGLIPKSSLTIPSNLFYVWS